MGRIFQTQTATTATQLTSGRIFNTQDNTKIEPFKSAKAWEDMSFGSKTWNTIKELPRALSSFIPESTKEVMTKGAEMSYIERNVKSIKGSGEFFLGMAQAVSQGIGGAVLEGIQKIIKKPISVKVPLLGEVSSYQVQAENLKQQGFSDNEAKALVGINAYLSFMPFIAKGLQTKPAGRIKQLITTKEVPFVETPEGMKAGIRAETIKPEIEVMPEVKPTLKKFEPLELAKREAEIEINKINEKWIAGETSLAETQRFNEAKLAVGQIAKKYNIPYQDLAKESFWLPEKTTNVQKLELERLKDLPATPENLKKIEALEIKMVKPKIKPLETPVISKELQPLAFIKAKNENNVIRIISDRELEQLNKTGILPLSQTGEMILIAKGGFENTKNLGVLEKSKKHLVVFNDSVLKDLKSGDIGKEYVVPDRPISKSEIKEVISNIWNKDQQIPQIKPTVEAGEAIAPEPLVRVERPLITGIKKLFGKTEEQKQFNQLLQDHLDKYFEGRQTLLGKEDPLNKSLIKLTDEELSNYSKVTQGLEVPENKITPNLKSSVELWKKTNAEIEADLIQRGKLTPEQVENRKWKPIETLTGKDRIELKETGIEPIYYPYLAEDLLKKSDFIASIGKRTKGGYLKRFTGKMLAEDSYIKNPKIAIPRHRVQVFKDKMNSELVDTIKTTFAEQDKIIIREYKNNPKLAEQMGVEEWKPQGAIRFYPTETVTGGKAIAVTKKVESYWIPKDIVTELNKFYKPGVLEKTLRMTYDPLIDMWRVSVLGLVPRWLYNNVIGNTMLSILGRTDPLAFFKSGKEMLARTKLGEKMGLGQREIPKGVFIKEYAGGEMAKAGQLGSLAKEQTQFLRPIENWLNLLEQAKNYKALRIPAVATQNLIKGWVALGKPIGYLNKVVENWFRGAMYISKTEGKFLGFKLDKPVPPAEGLNYVNEFLFDYTKLSRAERATFRRVLPFWNWMKNITEFSLKFPIKHPLRGLVVNALLQDYVDYINEVNQKEDKTKSVLRIKTDMTYENKPLYLNIKSAIPFSDVFRTIPTNFETFGRFLTSNPISKIIIERAFKLNSFTGQPFTQPTEKQQFDEYGKPIRPLPSLPEHFGQQMPQVKLGQAIIDKLQYGEVLKRYETGEPKMYRGQIQISDLLVEILKYFGISLSATEYNEIKKSVDRKTRLQEIKSNRYERQLESGLERLKNQ